MRVRLCIAAESSTSAAMSSSSSSRAAAARGRRPRVRGFCDRRGSGDAFVSGDEHLRAVSEENQGRRARCGGDDGSPGAVPGPPRDPGFRFGPPHPGPRPQPPPFYRPPLPRHAWQPPPFYGSPLPRHAWQPPPPGFGPQHPLAYGAPPWGPCPPPPPRPRPRPADYRSWVPSSLPPPPPGCGRFRVLSYNILADYLAKDHQSMLYFHIPPELLHWEWRKSRLLIEFGLWSPDIMCLQEVDKFQDIEEELARCGYNGVWKMRTGNAVDGCAIFWRRHRFVLRHEEHIEFAKLGLRDNVAQICVLETTSQRPPEDGSEALSTGSNPSLGTNRVVVCNIHVLYNPKRGEIKLGQVRVLLERAYSVSKLWNNAPVIVCGDFNCTPKSPLYNFVSGQQLSLSGLARNAVSGQHSACIYPPRPYAGSGYRGHPPHNSNDGNAAPVKLDDHQTGIKDHHNTQNNVENTLLVDKLSSLYSSEKCFTYSQPENEERTECDATSVEVGGFDSFSCEENDSSKGTVKGIMEPSKVMTIMKGKWVENPTSRNASSEGNLHSIVGLQDNNKYVKDSSFIMETLDKHDEQVNNQQFVTPGNKGTLHGSLDSVNEVKHVSTIHTSCMFSTMRQDFVEFDVTKDTSNSCHNIPPSEGNQEGFPPENHCENSLVCKSESNKFPNDVIMDISTHERISRTSTVCVGTPLPGSIEPSTGLVFGQQKSDLDVSCQNSCINEPLDSSNFLETQLNLEPVDSSVNEVKEMMKHASCSSDQVVADAHKKLPGVTEDTASQNIMYGKPSTQDSGDAAFSNGIGINDNELTSCLLGDEDNSDSSFLAELHGIGNVPEFSGGLSVAPLSSQSMFQPFPDPFAGQRVGEEEVESERLHSNISHQQQQSSKIQEKVYDPLLWTPMEIEAASGNVECTFLKHNLNLKSAYTEVEDYMGTKDSSREPQVTSYNRQFMGTVDYIWHSEELQTVQVLDTIPKHILRRTPGFPTKKWGSDHLSLACEFAFKKA